MVGSILNCFIRCSPVIGPGRPITPQEIEEELRRRQLQGQAGRRPEDDEDDDDEEDDNNNNNGEGFSIRTNNPSSHPGITRTQLASLVQVATVISQLAAARGIRITPGQVIQLPAIRLQALRFGLR